MKTISQIDRYTLRLTRDAAPAQEGRLILDLNEPVTADRHRNMSDEVARLKQYIDQFGPEGKVRRRNRHARVRLFPV